MSPATNLTGLSQASATASACLPQCRLIQPAMFSSKASSTKSFSSTTNSIAWAPQFWVPVLYARAADGSERLADVSACCVAQSQRLPSLPVGVAPNELTALNMCGPVELLGERADSLFKELTTHLRDIVSASPSIQRAADSSCEVKSAIRPRPMMWRWG
jgi:hypothetical protein